MTESSAGKPGPTLLFWILILALVASALLFVPLAPCPICALHFEMEQVLLPAPGTASRKPYPVFSKGCESCWRGRQGLYRRWKDPQLEPEY